MHIAIIGCINAKLVKAVNDNKLSEAGNNKVYLTSASTRMMVGSCVFYSLRLFITIRPASHYKLVKVGVAYSYCHKSVQQVSIFEQLLKSFFN